MGSGGKIEEFLTDRRNLIVAGTRADGRPHVTPNWFTWDGERFYVSTTRARQKYAIFRRNPRAQLLLDDPEGLRAVLILLSDQEHLESLIADERVLLAITPDGPAASWTSWGFG